jgi:hypothetical protein
MMSSVFTAALLLAIGRDETGGLCDLSIADSRVFVYTIAGAEDCRNNRHNAMENPPPDSPQRAFLVQHKANMLSTDGFRTTVGPLTGTEVVNLARIAAVEPRTDGLNLLSTNVRYYTVPSPDNDQILISIVGNELVIARSFDGMVQQERLVETLLPSDVLNGVLELDTRIRYNDPSLNAFRGMLTVEVCSHRGVNANGCHTFTTSTLFGRAAPEFYLGDSIQEPSLRARFCKLPAFGVQHGSGYTSTCRGPGEP